MIRPITIVTFLMASGSGLYLYQSKHEVQLLDRTIEKTVHETDALREQSRLLSAEWTMLNDPDRLRQFADTYLSLRTINPAQFTSLNDLDNRLPAVQVEAPPPAEPPAEPEPILDGETKSPPAAAVDELSLPVPPIPNERPALAARPIEAKVALAGSPLPADVKPADPRPYEQRRVAEARPEIRPPPEPPPRSIVLAAPRAQPAVTQPAVAPIPNRLPVVAARAVAGPIAPVKFAAPVRFGAPVEPVRQALPPAAGPAPYSGSLLGMAHGSMPPAPRPLPVNATYNAN